MVKMTAISRIGDNGTSTFYTEEGAEVFFSEIKNEKENSIAKLFDINKNLMASICYSCSRNSMPAEYLLKINGGQLLFLFNKVSNELTCEEKNLKLKRGLFDKSFKFFVNEKLLVKAKTYNLARDYIRAKYQIELFDDGQVVFACSICLIYFILVYESATYTQANNLGGFGGMFAR